MSLLSLPSRLAPWRTQARIADLGREIAHRHLEDAWQCAGEQALELPPHQARGYLEARTALLIRRGTRQALETSKNLPQTSFEQVERRARDVLMTLLVARLRAARSARVARRRAA